MDNKPAVVDLRCISDERAKQLCKYTSITNQPTYVCGCGGGGCGGQLRSAIATKQLRSAAGWCCSVSAGRDSAQPAPGGVVAALLRQLCLPLRGVWALTSSELPWAVPDGPT